MSDVGMMMRLGFHSTILLTLVLTVLPGCGSSDGRLSVVGTAMLDGQPVPRASVSFRPIDHQGSTAGTSLVDGKFTITADHGLLPGRYSVRFETTRPTGRKVQSPELGPVDEIAVVEITGVQPAEVTVTADGPNVFEFQLQSKK